MKKTLFLLSAALILCFDSAFGWGKMGHDAIAYIAECHLTPKAKKTIEKYIGTSIVHYASWMDAYRFEPQYAHTSLWHTAWVDENDEYDPTRKPDGNAIKGIEDTMELLRDYKSLDDSTVVVSIKYLVHLVGDMHCPTHVKYPRHQGLQHLRRRPQAQLPRRLGQLRARLQRAMERHGVPAHPRPLHQAGRSRPSPPDRCATGSTTAPSTAGKSTCWHSPTSSSKVPTYGRISSIPHFPSPNGRFSTPATGWRTCSTNCSDNTPSNTNTKTAILSGSPFSTNTVRPISSRRASVSRPGRRSSPNRLREPPRQPQVRPQAAVRPSFP